LFKRVSTNKETSILIELFEKSSNHDNRSPCFPMMARRRMMDWSNHLLGWKEAHVLLDEYGC
jgi:hypothetical protein